MYSFFIQTTFLAIHILFKKGLVQEKKKGLVHYGLEIKESKKHFGRALSGRSCIFSQTLITQGWAGDRHPPHSPVRLWIISPLPFWMISYSWVSYHLTIPLPTPLHCQLLISPTLPLHWRTYSDSSSTNSSQFSTWHCYQCRGPIAWPLSSLTSSSLETATSTSISATNSYSQHLQLLHLWNVKFTHHTLWPQVYPFSSHSLHLFFACKIPLILLLSVKKYSLILDFTLLHFNHSLIDILNSLAPQPLHHPHMQIPTLAQSNYVTLNHWAWLAKNHPMDLVPQ